MLQDLPKVRRVSTLLLGLCWFILISLPLFEAYVWLDASFLVQVEHLQGMTFDPASLTPIHKMGGFFISMIGQGILMYGFWRLRALFSAYRRGDLFAAETAGHLKVFSICMLIQMLLNPFTQAAITALVTSGNPVGERMVAISFSSDDIYMILLASSAIGGGLGAE